MYHKRGPMRGRVEFAKAYNTVFAQADENRIRSLSALKKNLTDAYGVDDIAKLAIVEITEVVSRLKSHLSKKGRAQNYINNQSSTLNHVIRLAKPVDDGRELSPWSALFREVIGTTGTPEEKRASEFFEWCARENGITPDTFDPKIHLAGFSKFLEQNTNLKKDGNRRNFRRHVKRLLIKMGYAFPEPSKHQSLPKQMEDAILRIEKFATNTEDDQLLPSGKRKLWAELQGNPDPILPRTWRVTEHYIRNYLRFFQVREPQKFTSTNLSDWLVTDRIKEFLDDIYERDAYSVQTTQTFFTRLIQVYRYAADVKLNGFEDLANADKIKFRKDVWSLIPHVRKCFRKNAVRERIEKNGGIPDWKLLHREYEQRSKSVKKLINQKKKRVDLLRHKKKESGARKIELQIALHLKELLVISLHLYFGPRNNDVTQTIRVSDLRRVTDDLYHLKYVPSKMSRKPKPPIVDFCLPPWLTPWIEDYLKNYHQFIYPGAKLLFPANIQNKRAQVKVAYEGEISRANYREFMERLSLKYCGQVVSVNLFRKSANTFYKLHGLQFREYIFGRSHHATIENTHYVFWEDRDRIELGRKHWEEVVRLLT